MRKTFSGWIASAFVCLPAAANAVAVPNGPNGIIYQYGPPSGLSIEWLPLDLSGAQTWEEASDVRRAFAQYGVWSMATSDLVFALVADAAQTGDWLAHSWGDKGPYELWVADLEATVAPWPGENLPKAVPLYRYVTPVPEPATWASLAAGLLLVSATRARGLLPLNR